MLLGVPPVLAGADTLWTVDKLTIDGSKQVTHNFGSVLDVDGDLLAAGGGASLFLFRRGARGYEYCGQVGNQLPQHEYPVLQGPDGRRITVNVKAARLSGDSIIVENYRLDSAEDTDFRYKTQMDVLAGDRQHCTYHWTGLSLWTQDKIRYVDQRMFDFADGIAVFGRPDRSVPAQISQRHGAGWDLVTELPPPPQPAGSFFGSHGSLVSVGTTTLIALGNVDRDNPANSTVEFYVLERQSPARIVATQSFAAPATNHQQAMRQSFATDLELGAYRLRQGLRFFEITRTGERGYALSEMAGSPLTPRTIKAGREIRAIAFAGDLAAVGAPLKFDWQGGPDSRTHPGEVFVFEHRDGTWRELAALPTPPDATGDFGAVVRVQGNEIFVSDPLGQSVYVFRR